MTKTPKMAKLGYVAWQDWGTQLNRMERKLDRLLNLTQTMESEMTAMDDAVAALGTQVQANTDAETSAATLLSTLAGLIQKSANDPAAVNDLATKLKASADALAASIVANTPAA